MDDVITRQTEKYLRVVINKAGTWITIRNSKPNRKDARVVFSRVAQVLKLAGIGYTYMENAPIIKVHKLEKKDGYEIPN